MNADHLTVANPQLKIQFSPVAEADLEEIGDYIARDNPRRAVSFIREMRQRCANIVMSPMAAPLRPELGAGIRMAPLKTGIGLASPEPE